MPMPERDPAAAARAAANQGLAEAMEAAVQFYRLQLAAARAAEARAYLDRRGLAPAARDRFEIGFAPDEPHRAPRAPDRQGLPARRASSRPASSACPTTAAAPTTASAAGSSSRSATRAAAPSPSAPARSPPGQEPKYLNSPETPLFDKGRTLYNVGPARAAAGQGRHASIVAEGYMDVIALAEAGIDHAVAPLGTAITEAQLETALAARPRARGRARRRRRRPRAPRSG